MQKTVIIIVGPTAVGKTSLSLDLAQLLQTEIVSADSRQCFKEMNIGVAKPTVQQLELVKHHFINSHSVMDEVNASVFEDFALRAVSSIFEERDVAVMVGGTGLYIHAFVHGLDVIPPIDPEIKRLIQENYRQQGLEWLQSTIQQQDNLYSMSGEMRNPHRLMRALEVKMATGKSIRSFQKSQQNSRPFRVITIGLELPRAELYKRIDQRTDEMMANGLMEEAKELFPLRHLKALQTVGYTEAFAAMEGKITLYQALELIKRNTRRYAKRQMTWFRKKDSTSWFNAHDRKNIINECLLRLRQMQSL